MSLELLLPRMEHKLRHKPLSTGKRERERGKVQLLMTNARGPTASPPPSPSRASWKSNMLCWLGRERQGRRWLACRTPRVATTHTLPQRRPSRRCGKRPCGLAVLMCEADERARPDQLRLL